MSENDGIGPVVSNSGSSRLSTSPELSAAGGLMKDMNDSQDSLPDLSPSHSRSWFIGAWNSNNDINTTIASISPNKDAPTGTMVDIIKRRRCFSEGGQKNIFGMWRPSPTLQIDGDANAMMKENFVGRIRRASTKDVEEAMAGGLNKATIYMPPV